MVNVQIISKRPLVNPPLQQKKRKKEEEPNCIQNMNFLIIAASIGAANAEVLSGGNGVELHYNFDDNGGYIVEVDGSNWFQTPKNYNPGGWRDALVLDKKSIKTNKGQDPNLGPFDSANAVYHSKDGWSLETAIRVFNKPYITFTACYPNGAHNPDGIWSADEVISAFPAFSVSQSPLNYLAWSGNQLFTTGVGKWNNFTGDAVTGNPALVYNGNLRAAMIGPYNNFLTSVHTTRNSSTDPTIFAAGVKGSISELKSGFCHTTIMAFGQGINGTAMLFGDALLQRSGKQRTNAKNDFVLSNLGYWTDNGAYYYHQCPGFQNPEEALLAVKSEANKSDIPLQYFQWDDWWFYQYKGDGGGLIEWKPYPNIFPSGMTKWLGYPLSLYMATYNQHNVYVDDYKFVFDNTTNHSLPIDKNFYLDLFKNGTAIGMKMFEQDLLSVVNTRTLLTNSDTDTGDMWLDAMDAAAEELDVSLQFCMMDPCHALKTTEIKKVTNARGSRDAVGVADRHIVLGMSGILHYSLGMWPSADNVRTTAVEDGDTRAPPLYTNIISILVGGPYGPSDEVGKLNKTTIMQTCRDDGLLLRADKPVTMVESAFRNGFVDANPLAVWSTYSEIDGYRWGYVLGLNLNNPYPLLSSDINDFKNSTYRVFSYLSSEGMKQTTEMNAGTPFMIPACPEPGTQPPQLGHGYHVAAPLLNGGWYFLGEVGKIVSASTVRVKSVASDAATLTLQMEGVSNEVVQIGFIKPSSTSTSFFSCPTPTCSLKSCPVTIACSLSQCSCK
eukprot:TRINITY_DN721_c0_g1_i13.p1 TRINITY_DN721_c0_g1~~TRINITY_DN721_c0_g1_i13.p1  ORF type:complete len:780 (+),score=134.53 TRINITY_DN721_c0_g1_i13:115-2454(+)